MPNYNNNKRDTKPKRPSQSTPRSYDRESGMNRTSRPVKPVIKEDESEDDQFSDSDVEEFVQAPHRDDSLRPRTEVVKDSTRRGKPQQEKPSTMEAGPESVEPVVKPEPKPGSSGSLFLLAIARHIKPVPRQHSAQNFYVPDAANMFEAIHQMTKLVIDNVKLYELLPDYTSIAISLYYSHVYFYQILRARDAIGVITRLERRSLNLYASIGKPEAWPIAIPLTGFIQALGMCQIDDKMYSFVAPAFPDWKFTARAGLTGLSISQGIGRTPIVPAYQEFLRLFSHKTGGAHYNEDLDVYFPKQTPLSPDNQFIGLRSSAANAADFQTLAFSSAWNEAAETEEPIGSMSRGGVMTRVKRWQIPKIENTHDFSAGMENYLFTDQSNIKWMHNLLRVSAQVNKFFPGSTNLGAIPPVTTRETFAQVTYTTRDTNARITQADTWYQPRRDWNLSMQSTTYGDSVNPLLQMAVATSTNAHYSANLVPAIVTVPFSAGLTGPFFSNEGYAPEITVPVVQADVENQVDVASAMPELLLSLYENNPQ